MNLKEQYQRFRQWQRRTPQPVNHHAHEVVVCQHCGQEFSDNFCPRCGQRAGAGRVGWKAVEKSLAFIWGMDSTSLLYSLWQLLWRPGYLIRDYISGHFQVSYQPIKMTLVLGVFVALLDYLLGPITPAEETSKVGIAYLDSVIEWMDKNQGWGDLLACSFMILPTWLLFRFAPRYPRHTLPEGFFIQVFMAALLLLFTPLEYLSLSLVLVVTLFYFVWTYHQLFGYSIWGTVWRLFVSGVELLIVLIFVLSFNKLWDEEKDAGIQLYLILIFLILLAINGVILYGLYYIGKRTSKHRG